MGLYIDLLINRIKRFIKEVRPKYVKIGGLSNANTQIAFLSGDALYTEGVW